MRKESILSLVIVISLIFLTVAFTESQNMDEELRKGMEAYENGDYEEAINIFNKFTKQGNLLAPVILVFQTTKGRNVEG